MVSTGLLIWLLNTPDTQELLNKELLDLLIDFVALELTRIL